MQLAIPEIKPATNKPFPNTVKKVKKWLLEVENLDSSVRIKEFYQLIIKLNRAGIAPKELIEMLELLRPTADFCINHLRQKYSKLPLPLPAKTLAIFRLAVTLTDEMALGYKIAVHTLISKKTLFSGSWILMGIERAMYYLNNMLLHYAQIYTSVQTPSWQDLNALYAKSIELKIEDKKVVDAFYPNHEKVSIKELYKAASLFSLSNPYSLRKGEAVKLFKQIPEWLDLFEITSKKPAKASNYFITDLSTALPPASPELIDDFNTGSLQYLVLDKLIDEVAKLIKKNQHKKTELIQGEELNVTALARLDKNWIKRDNVRPKRKLKPAPVTVEVGLNNISDHILEDLVESDDPFIEDEEEEKDTLVLEGVPEQKKEEGEQYLLHPTFHQNNPSEADDVWEQVSRGNVLTPQYEKELLKKRKEREELKLKTKDHVWLLQNVSAGGYNLKWTGTGSPQAHVGEVIGLREGKAIGGDWHVAVIRWIQYESEKAFNIGVQAISNQAIIATAKRTTGDEKIDTRQNCLILPAIKAIGQPLTLLAPAFMYKVGEELFLEFNDTDQYVLLEKIFEHTGSFTQFVIKPIEKKDEEDESLSEEVSSEYDQVWSIL